MFVLHDRLMALVVVLSLLLASGFSAHAQSFETALAGADPELRAELLARAAGLSASLFESVPTTASGERAESSFAVLHGLYWLAANFASHTPTGWPSIKSM